MNVRDYQSCVYITSTPKPVGPRISRTRTPEREERKPARFNMQSNTSVKASSNCYPRKGSKIRVCMSLMFPILKTFKSYRQPVAKKTCVGQCTSHAASNSSWSLIPSHLHLYTLNKSDWTACGLAIFSAKQKRKQK